MGGRNGRKQRIMDYQLTYLLQNLQKPFSFPCNYIAAFT